MTELESKEILSQVYFERYKNGIQNSVLSLINKACEKVKEELRKTDGVYTKARYHEIEKALKEISKALSENIENEIDVEGVVNYELERQIKLLDKYGGIANLTLPTTEQIMKAVTFKPFAGMTFQNYLNGIEAGFYNLWDAEVRTGYLIGEPTQKIIRNIMGRVSKNAQLADVGKINALRNSITMNTRTALQSMANETRLEVFGKNEQLFRGYKWVATLDKRTCLVCGEYDGHVFDKLAQIPEIPLHRNCRCLTIPVVKGLDDVDIEIERVSMNGYVDGKITYAEWLKEQPASVQLDVLGKARYDYYTKHGEDITTFVADNRVLTLSELKNKM